MHLEYKKIKKLGSNTYYLSKDKKFFIKEYKRKLETLRKEYINLQKMRNELSMEDFEFIEPVEFIEEKKRLITRYINAEPLINVLIPQIYFKFGQKLKEFHSRGYTHSHLEFTDILYHNGKFVLTDLTALNKYPPVYDIIGLNYSIKNYKLKRPWLWMKYNKCFKAFLKSYNFKVTSEYNVLFKEKAMRKVVKFLKQDSPLLKIKGFIFKILIKSGLILWL